MRFSLSAALFALLLILPAPAWPQTDAARRRELAQTFVDQVAPADQFAIWTGRICPAATGFRAREGLRLLERIRTHAREVGLRAGEQGCTANVVVIGAPDSDALARGIVNQRLDLLGYRGGELMTDEARAALDRFADTPRAVRWWHVAQHGAGYSQSLANQRSQSGQSARDAVNLAHAGVRAASVVDDSASRSRAAMSGMQGVRTNGSRVRPALRVSLDRVLIIVDTRRVAAVDADAWMDYVAMGALAQLNPDAQTPGAPTILSLFSSPQTTPPRLSAWDAAYLRGLYHAAPGSTRHQRTQIAARMADRLASAPPS